MYRDALSVVASSRAAANSALSRRTSFMVLVSSETGRSRVAFIFVPFLCLLFLSFPQADGLRGLWGLYA
jgi:hypothetical protein